MESEYERLTNAIAEALFGSESAGLPVYCLPDPDLLKSIVEGAGLCGGGKDALFAVVRSTLHLQEPGTPPLKWHVDSTALHARHPLETPATLPLLVLLAMAAENMHSDDEHAAHNYYMRLFELLDVPDEDHSRFISDYRRHARGLWGSLSTWLEAWEGARGVPTAHAVGSHDYVGLPISQAVVRQYDREGLRDFFSLDGFTPGQRVVPSEMAAALEACVASPSNPLSSHVVALWSNAAARERIVDAACIELESWDGAATRSLGGGRKPPTRLLAFLRRFPRIQIEFNVSIPYALEDSAMARFTSVTSEVAVPTVAGPGGSTRLSRVQSIDSASLVADQLAGYLGTGDDLPIRREPRGVVPLRRDDIQGGFQEVETIGLGDEALVLVRSDARTQVEHYLADHARAGWVELAGLPGVPEGWIVYEKVQIISVPPSQSMPLVLVPLAPRARTSLTMHGGFRLPGLLRKWSSLEPPEVIAIAAGADATTLRVYDGNSVEPTSLVAEVAFPGELGVLSLADQELEDGDYLVALFINDEDTSSSTAILRLRSSSTPQFSVAEDDIRLVYSPNSSPLWALAAGPAEWPAYVNGARVDDLPAPTIQVKSDCREYTVRSTRPRDQMPARVSVGIPVAEDSCLFTGRHKYEHPTAFMPGHRSARTIEGECASCGSVKRSAGTAWAARRRAPDSLGSKRLLEIPSVTRQAPEDLSTALDALNHIGHGTLGALERVASQIDGSGLLADMLVRRLEVLGHIDVARDDGLRPTEWAVNAPALVPIADGTHVLIGARSGVLVRRLKRALPRGTHLEESVDAGLPRIAVRGTLPVEILEEIGIAVLAESPAEIIASALTPLSTVASSLKRQSVPKYRSAEYWDTSSASWIDTDSLVRTGAYRLRDFESIYCIRSPEDVEHGTLGLGTAQLVKHVANLWARDTLVGYHSKSSSVVVPLGADLPGLYGRALSLCSGRAPNEIEKVRLLQYPGVPRSIADIIYTRLSQ